MAELGQNLTTEAKRLEKVIQQQRELSATTEASLRAVQAALSGVPLFDAPKPSTDTSDAGRVEESLAKTQDIDGQRRPSVMKDIAPVLREIIAEAGRPMRPSEMIPRLEERGLMIGGKRPDANLSARLGQSGLFKLSEDKRGWVPVEDNEA